MPMSLLEEPKQGVVEVFVRGKLTKDDYERFVPEVEELIRTHGGIRVLFDMHDFHGWELEALWEDLKFDLKHFSDVERIAMIGEKRWQKWMATFCRPFTRADIRYFDRPDAEEARVWLSARSKTEELA